MQQGWICLHRGLLDWEWYSDINVTRLFIHCLLRANHKPKQWRGIDIDRGQFWTSLPSLEQETGLSASQIRTCINKLKSTGELAVKSQATGRMITVLKYNSYQDNDRLSSRLVTDQSQTSDRPVTANNNDNHEYNENPVTKEIVTIEEKEQKKKRIKKPESFSRFFSLYPSNKKGGTDATAWKKAKSLKLTSSDFEMMANDVINRKAASPEWHNRYAQGITKYMEEKIWLTPLPETAIENSSIQSNWGHLAQSDSNQLSERAISNKPEATLITNQQGDITL